MSDDINFDEWDDDSLDFGGFDDSPTAPENDRNPVTVIPNSFLDGVKSKSTDKSFVAKVLKDSLPTGYSKGLTAADGLMSDVVTEATKTVADIKPAVDGFKRAMSLHSGKVKKLLPESWGGKIDKMLEVKDTSSGGYGETQDQQITGELAKIFAVQAEAQDKSDTVALTKDIMSEDKLTKRHDATMSQATLTQDALNRLVSYQDTVTSAFQKKSLDLQFRQFFAARDLLDVTKTAFTDFLDTFKVIAKNTGLPEHVKLQNNEAFDQIVRENLIGKVNETVGEKLSTMTAGFRQNLLTKVGETKDKFIDGMGQGTDILDGIAQIDEVAEMTGGPKSSMGETAASFGAQMAGSTVVEKAGARVTKFLRGIGGKSDRFQSGSNKVHRVLNNIPETINEYGQSHTEQDGLVGSVINFFKAAIPTIERDSISVLHNLKDKGTEPTAFDISTRRSIVEIIPGFLSKILQQNVISNTGDVSTEREVFNIDKEEFTSESVARDDAANSVFSNTALTSLADSVNDVLDTLDAGSEVKLSKEARDAFGLQILKDQAGGLQYRPERYMAAETFPNSVDDTVVGEIRGWLTDRYDMDADSLPSDSNTIADKLRRDDVSVKRLQSELPVVQDNLNSYVAAGNKDLLRQSNLLDKDEKGIVDTFNFDNYWDNIADSISGVVTPTSAPEPTRPVKESVPTTTYATPDHVTSTSVNLTRIEDLLGTGNNTSDEILNTILEVLTSNDSNVTLSTSSSFTGIEELLRASNSTTSELLDTILEVNTSDVFGPPDYTRPITELNEGITSSNDILSKILAKLDAGLTTGDSSNGIGINPAGSLLGSLANMAGSTFTKGKDTLKSYYSTMFGLGSSGLSKITKLGGKAFSFTKDKLTDIIPSDIFVGASERASLLAKDIKAGKYIDKLTGKVIRTVDDIKGEVVDRAGNVIISAEDFAEGLYSADGTSIGSKMLDWAKTKPMEYLTNYYSGIFNIGKSVLKTARSSLGKLEDYLNDVGDVYVRGETTPRLLKILLHRGEYISARTGREIMSVHDIDGEVLNSKGDVVLSMEDLEKGLVDSRGKKVETKSLLSRATNLVSSTVRKGLDLAASGLTKLGDLYGGMFKGIGGIVGNISDRFSSLFNSLDKADIETVNVRAKIVRIIEDPTAFNDGDSSEATSEFVGPMPQTKTDNVKDKVSSFTDKIKGSVKDKVSDTKDNVKDFVSDKATKVKDSVGERLNKSKTYNTVKDSLSNITDKLTPKDGMFSGFMDSIRSRFSKDDNVSDSVNKSTDDITNKLDELSPEPVVSSLDKLYGLVERLIPKKVLGDSDGDGIRDGSYASQRIKDAKDAIVSNPKVVAAKGVGTGLLGKLGGLFKGRGNSPVEDESSFLGDVAGDLGSDLGADYIGDKLKGDGSNTRGPRTRGGGRGILGKLKSLGSKAIGGAGSVVKGGLKLGAGMLTTSAMGLGSGAVAGAGAGAGLLGGLGTVGSAVGGTIGGAVGGVGGAIGGAGAGLLTGLQALAAANPIGAGVLAAAALGYGAYKLGNHFFNTSDPEELESLRYAQYGIDQDNSDQLSAIRQLEDDVMDQVEYDPSGAARLKINFKELVDDHGDNFDVSMNDRESILRFTMWVRDVFKPALLTHSTLARKIDDDIDLLDIDDEMDDDKKADFINQAFNLVDKKPTRIPFANSTPSIDVTSVYQDLVEEYGESKLKEKEVVEKPTPTPEVTKSSLLAAVTPNNVIDIKTKEPIIPVTPTKPTSLPSITSKLGVLGTASTTTTPSMFSGTNSTSTKVRGMTSGDNTASTPSILDGVSSILSKLPAVTAVGSITNNLSNMYDGVRDAFTSTTDVNPLSTPQETEAKIPKEVSNSIATATFAEQQQKQRAVEVNLQLSEVNNTLRESLIIQKSMDMSLQRIDSNIVQVGKAIENRPVYNGDTNEQGTPVPMDTSKIRSAFRTNSELKSGAPVSMRKAV